MTLNDLQTWRKRVPFFIFIFSLVPWFLIMSKTTAGGELANKIIAPAIGLLGTFFYVSLGVPRARWRRENETHVGKLICDRLLDMVPKDLRVSESERLELAKSHVYKQLTGVFWEAIDRNDVLKSHKEHFYSNGIIYSTSIDVYLICGFAGLCYAVASLVLTNIILAYGGAVLIAIAVASRVLVTPHTRRSHMTLSAEQLDLLQREEHEFVSDRFREIVVRWRRARPLP